MNIYKDIPIKSVKNFYGVEEVVKCDVYTPKDNNSLKPAILWIHGGGFRPGTDKNQPYIVHLAKEMTKRGYVSISTDYRVRDDTSDRMGTFKDALEDVCEAFKWIISNSEKYGIDKNNIMIAGGSAGGMLAVNLCLKGVIPDRLRNSISYLIDLWGTPKDFIVPNGIDKSFPKTIIVHGTKDDIINIHLSELFIEKLKLNKVPYHFYPIKDAKHSPKEHLDDIVDFIIENLMKESSEK